MRFIFSYSAIAYFPLPTLEDRELRNPHLASACKFDLFVSSAVSKFLGSAALTSNLISPDSSHTPAKRIFGSRSNISFYTFV